MLTFTKDQKKAREAIISWFTSSQRSPYITLGGYAGTGKTTLIGALRKDIHAKKKKLSVAFCSYTGKATRVLKSALVNSNTVYTTDSISTIHGLIYSPIVDDDEVIIGWKKKDEIAQDLIIIDEASMVDETIWNDLVSYGIPIIAVGDHGQLPPIRGSFSLMQDPELKLETIHRQAAGNPIIDLSIQARTEGKITPCRTINSTGVAVKIRQDTPESREEVRELLDNFTHDTLVLCGYNHTRVKLNKHIRESLGFTQPTPEVNDRVICLRNNHEEHIYNGMMGSILSIRKENKDWYKVEIQMDDENGTYDGYASVSQFGALSGLNFTKDRSLTVHGDLFDFGYALTVHKAQGSQAERVILFEERFSKMDDDMWRRWLYTGVTRAERELWVVGAANL